MTDGQQTLTRDVLREELARYPTREELREELGTELARYPTREELREELGQFVQLLIREQEKAEQRHQELMRQLARATTATAEEHRREVGVLDDRYRDLPGRVVALERGLREHVEDAAAHGRPRRPTRKR